MLLSYHNETMHIVGGFGFGSLDTIIMLYVELRHKRERTP